MSCHDRRRRRAHTQITSSPSVTEMWNDAGLSSKTVKIQGIEDAQQELRTWDADSLPIEDRNLIAEAINDLNQIALAMPLEYIPRRDLGLAMWSKWQGKFPSGSHASCVARKMQEFASLAVGLGPSITVWGDDIAIRRDSHWDIYSWEQG